jgi:hypothetical protein
LAIIYVIDVFCCPKCGGRMSVVAVIRDTDEIRKIINCLKGAGGFLNNHCALSDCSPAVITHAGERRYRDVSRGALQAVDTLTGAFRYGYYLDHLRSGLKAVKQARPLVSPAGRPVSGVAGRKRGPEPDITFLFNIQKRIHTGYLVRLRWGKEVWETVIRLRLKSGIIGKIMSRSKLTILPAR